jgi:hypothetical protein
LALATAEELSSGMQSVLDKEREFEQESNRIRARNRRWSCKFATCSWVPARRIRVLPASPSRWGRAALGRL